jgi:hypothetical protein
LVKTVRARNELSGAANHAKFIGFVATRFSDRQARAAAKQDFAELQKYIASLVDKTAFVDSKKPMFLPLTIPDSARVISMTRDLTAAAQSGQSVNVFEKEGTGRNDAGAAYQQLVEEVLKRASINEH